jgi:hypothetical protein
VLAFWQGLELAWISDPTSDFLAHWNRFADRFFG